MLQRFADLMLCRVYRPTLFRRFLSGKSGKYYEKSLLVAYDQLVNTGSVVRDEHQEMTLAKLDQLSKDLVSWDEARLNPSKVVHEPEVVADSSWSWFGFRKPKVIESAVPNSKMDLSG